MQDVSRYQDVCLWVAARKGEWVLKPCDIQVAEERLQAFVEHLLDEQDLLLSLHMNTFHTPVAPSPRYKPYMCLLNLLIYQCVLNSRMLPSFNKCQTSKA